MDFQKEVIEKSKEQPVVVDFWAPWCAPCQALGPVIEEIASEAEGKWQLVKVNTDEYPDLMQEYRVRGIPAVKMFHNGEVLAEFGGALPKFQIEKWLEKYLPTEEKLAFAAIEETLNQDPANLDALRDFIEIHPEFGEAKLLLAKHILFQEPSKAKELIEGIKPGHPFYYKSEPLKHLLELMTLAPEETIAVAEKLSQARNAASLGNYDAVLEELIAAVMMDKDYQNELPRRATIAMFQWLGADHELTRKNRKRFDMALY